jgi:hypothetical protein
MSLTNQGHVARMRVKRHAYRALVIKPEGLEVAGEYDIVTYMSVTIKGFRLVIGFTEYLQIVTSSNYSASANLHTQQFTTESIKSFQSAVFTSRCLVTASNGERSPYSGLPNYHRASALSF